MRFLWIITIYFPFTLYQTIYNKLIFLQNKMQHPSVTAIYILIVFLIPGHFSFFHILDNITYIVEKGETVWTINIQDLALIGRLFTKGIVDMQKKVALTGPLASGAQYYNVLPGMPLSAIFTSNVHKGCNARLIAGNPLSGHQVTMEEMTSIYDNQYTVIAEGDETHEFMGWIMPRFNSFNAGKTDPAKMVNNCVTEWLFGKL